MPSDTPSDRDILDSIAQARGARALAAVELPPEAKRYYTELSLRAEDLIASARRAVPGLPPIHFDFVLHPEVNAFAALENGRYFIGVNTGLLFLLRLIIGRMLSDQTLFRWVGDPDKESAELPKIEFYVPHADQMWASEELATPRDELRRAYAHYLTDRALMFFVGHEIAHISNGHVGYLAQSQGLSVYSERLDGSIADASLIERQCLELDADRRSVMASVNSIRDMQASPGFEGYPWMDGPRDTASLFRDWAVMITIVFRMLGDQQLSDTNLTRAYPPMLSRWQYAQGLARYGIDRFWPAEEREAAWSAMVEGTREVGRAFQTIIGNVLHDAPEPPPPEHLMMLQDHWNLIVLEKVRPYSYEF